MALPKDYDPDAALLACVQEHTMGVQSYEQQTRNTFDQAAPFAAQSIVHLAMYSTNENTRLRAATYIVERMLGRIGEERQASGALAPLEAMLADVVTSAEAIARGATR